jgi:hypothetical protein
VFAWVLAFVCVIEGVDVILGVGVGVGAVATLKDDDVPV